MAKDSSPYKELVIRVDEHLKSVDTHLENIDKHLEKLNNRTNSNELDITDLQGQIKTNSSNIKNNRGLIYKIGIPVGTAIVISLIMIILNSTGVF